MARGKKSKMIFVDCVHNFRIKRTIHCGKEIFLLNLQTHRSSWTFTRCVTTVHIVSLRWRNNFIPDNLPRKRSLYNEHSIFSNQLEYAKKIVMLSRFFFSCIVKRVTEITPTNSSSNHVRDIPTFPTNSRVYFNIKTIFYLNTNDRSTLKSRRPISPTDFQLVINIRPNIFPYIQICRKLVSQRFFVATKPKREVKTSWNEKKIKINPFLRKNHKVRWFVRIKSLQ